MSDTYQTWNGWLRATRNDSASRRKPTVIQLLIATLNIKTLMKVALSKPCQFGGRSM
jgi:hypothetical protein